MHYLRYRINFRFKIIIIFLVFLLISSFSVGFYSFYHARETVRQSQRESMAELVNLITMNIDIRISSLNRQMTQGATSLLVKNYVRDLPMQANESFREYYEAMLQAFGYVHAIYIIQGDRLYEPSNDTTQQLTAEQAKAFIEGATKYGESVHWEGALDPLGSEDLPIHVVRAYRGIFLEDNRVPDAVLVLELEPREFDGILLSNVTAFPRQYRMIVDRDNRLIDANKRMVDSLFNEIIARFDEGEQSFDINADGNNYYVQGQYDGLTGWRTFSIQDVASIFPSGTALIQTILVFTAISITLSSIVVIFTSLTITRPIKRLSDAMNDFRLGFFDTRLNPKGSDEMGQLMKSFNFMADEIDRLIKEVYIVEMAHQQAEIHALEAQINPHFLYNTLDTIKWALIEREAYDLSDIVTALGKMLRYSIDERQREVPLAREIESINDYLRIQLYRYETRLSYTIDIDEDLCGYHVPKQILQPLVENAIVHNIDNVSEVAIEITASVTDLLIIKIKDSGAGIGDEQLLNIQNSLMNHRTQGQHVGLYNVQRRISLQYGAPYGLTIDSRRGQGSVVTLRLPLISPAKRTTNGKGDYSS